VSLFVCNVHILTCGLNNCYLLSQMESDEDLLDLNVRGEDIEGMELDEPIQPETYRVTGGLSSPAHSDYNGGNAESVSVAVTVSGSERSKVKRKPRNYRRTQQALEKRREKRRKERKKRRQKLRAESRKRTEKDPKDNSVGEVRSRVQYDELTPGYMGTYYHTRSGATQKVHNYGPPEPLSSDDDDFQPEEYLEPEDRPWMKGYVRPANVRRMAEDPTPVPENQFVVERTTHNFFESPSRQLEKQAIEDKWVLLEREMLLRDLESDRLPTQAMPKDTIADFKKILNDPLKTAGGKQAPNIAFKKNPPDQNDQRVISFVAEVTRTRVLCVNTEGTEAWDDAEAKTGPRTMITLAALNGTVLFFADHRFVPTVLIEKLADPAITKIGCGLTKEFAELERVGLQLRNWVETGALRLALYSRTWEPFQPDPTRPKLKGYTYGARRYGIEEQVQDLKREGFLPSNYKRTDYRFYWAKDLDAGFVPTKMWDHVWENGRIPCAFLLLVVVDFARTRNLSDEHPAMGILNEALDLCRGRDPSNFQTHLEPNLRPKDWWFAHRGTGTPRDKMFLPAACEEMIHTRSTFADFTEPIEIENRDVVAQRVYDRFFGINPIPFPTCEEFDRDIKKNLILGRCGCCGAKDHVDNCPKVPNPTCEYNHDGEVELRPHTLEFCPILHNYCGMCCTVGHHERVHYAVGHQQTNRELRERYFRFMARGAFTSVPFLAFHPEGYKKLSSVHWNRCYEGGAYRRAAITRHLLGIGPEVLERLQEKARKQATHKNCQADRNAQIQMIRENIQKARHGETVPLPRDYIETLRKKREDQERLRRKAQAEKDLERRRQLTATTLSVKPPAAKRKRQRRKTTNKP